MHKQATSSRLRFLCLPSGVLAFNPLPANSLLRDESYVPRIRFHPVAAVRQAEIQLGLPEGAIAPEAEFHAWVDTPQGDVPVLLGAFSDIDPPFVAAERLKGRFISITDSGRLSDIERQLLRRAYEHALG